MRKVPHFVAAAVLAAAATTVFTGVASAHTKNISAKCEEKGTTLSVNLTAYSGNHTNTVVVTDGGKELFRTDFGANFNKSWTLDNTVKHSLKVEITAGDSSKFNGKWSEDIDACVKKPNIPTTTTTTTTTTVPPTTTTTTVAGTSSPSSTVTQPPATSPAPPRADELPDTGTSIAVPAILGGVLIVGGVGALMVVRRRAKN